MIDDILLEAEDKMDKAVEAARHEFTNIRTGRATSSMFEQLLVDYYGAPTPMQQLATSRFPRLARSSSRPSTVRRPRRSSARCASPTWV